MYPVVVSVKVFHCMLLSLSVAALDFQDSAASRRAEPAHMQSSRAGWVAQYCSLIFPKQRQQISLFVQKCSLYNFLDLTIRPNNWCVPKVCSQESLQNLLLSL